MVFEVGQVIKMKKAHPCGTNSWEILRVGMDLLTSKGVEYLQGYYFAKPMNEHDYLNFLQNNC